MFYLIETSAEGRIRKIGKGTKCAMEFNMYTMCDSRTMAIHKFKNDGEAMAFIKAHNGEPQPGTRFTSVPMVKP